MIQIHPVHVRRDLMLIGFTGNYRNGYLVTDLVSRIDEILPLPQSQHATIIGMGDLGKALLSLIKHNQNYPLQIPITFDIEIENTNTLYEEIPCYDLTKAPSLLQKHNIRMAILTVNNFELQEIADSLITLGIVGFINFSSSMIKVPKNICLKEFGLHTSLDEMTYFLDFK